MRTNFKPKVFQDKKKKLTLFQGMCKGCGLCIEKCPAKAISFSKSELGYLSTPTVVINIRKCISCGLCEIVCPDCALRLDKTNSAA